MKCSAAFPFQSFHGTRENSVLFHAFAVKTLKLCVIIIIATSVHDKRLRTRTELPTCTIVHVALTSVDSYSCDSHCLARLFENLPAPPKHYSISDVFPIRKIFCDFFCDFAKAENLGLQFRQRLVMTDFHHKVNEFWQRFPKCDPCLTLT